jgi:hypothetical protein
MEPTAATIVLIPHNNLDRSLVRLQRDIVPSLRHYHDWQFELVAVDNSETRLEPLAAALSDLPWPSKYIWNDGTNRLYGPAMNIAANVAAHPLLIYVCTNHGRMINPGWIDDLARPFREDDRVAIAGHPYVSPHPAALGLRDTGHHFHIQGGLLAARTDVIRRYPYNEDTYAHAGSDIWQSYRLMQEGFILRHVPSIISVWREIAPPGEWKYVHDQSEG